MKKSNGMMYPKRSSRTPKRLICAKCGQQLIPATAFYYVDENNCAITSSAKPYCRECYRDTYGR